MAAKFEVGKTYRVEGHNWRGIVQITGFGEEPDSFPMKIIKLETEFQEIKTFFTRPCNQKLWGDGEEWNAKIYPLQLENK